MARPLDFWGGVDISELALSLPAAARQPRELGWLECHNDRTTFPPKRAAFLGIR